jgi:Flp pilus assembly protein TadG
MTSAALICLRTCSQVFLPKLCVMKSATRFLRSDSGASAAEFAIVLPLFLLMFFGIIVFGFYLALVHGVQQLAAEAARSSVPGLSEAERASLAQSYVSDNVRSYGLIDPSKVAVTASASPTDANVFIVTVNYDASDSFIFGLRSLVPTPSPNIARSAAIPRGGF